MILLRSQSPPCTTWSSSSSGVEGTLGGTGLKVEGLPTLYIITPTYPRAEQLPELTRMGQTLLNVPNVVWIVSEDAPVASPAVQAYLDWSPLQTVYLRGELPLNNSVGLRICGGQ